MNFDPRAFGFGFDFNPAPPPCDARAERRQLGRLALAVAAVPVVSTLAQLVLLLVLSLALPRGTVLPEWFSLVAGSCCMYLVAMPVAYLLLRPCRVEAVRPARLGAVGLLAAMSLSMALTLAGNLLGMLVNFILSMLGLSAGNPVADTTAANPMWAIVLFMVILAPVLEELFFRKLLIDRLRRYGDVPAILISGLVFGLIHGNFSQFFYAALLGMLFGLVYCRTGRLRYSVFLHMFINFFGSVYVLLMQERLGGVEELTVITQEYLAEHASGVMMLFGLYGLYGIAFLTCIPAGIWLIRSFRPQKGVVSLDASDRRQAILCNPAVWLMAAVLLLNFALFLF